MVRNLVPVIAGLVIGSIVIVLFSLMFSASSPISTRDTEDCLQPIIANSTHADVSILNIGEPEMRNDEWASINSSVLANHPAIVDAVNKANLCHSLGIELAEVDETTEGEPDTQLAYRFWLPKEEALKLVNDPAFGFTERQIDVRGDHFLAYFYLEDTLYRANVSIL